MTADSRKRIWALCNDGSVYLSEGSGSTFSRVPSAPFSGTGTHSIVPIWVEDRCGTVWLAARGGLFGFYDESTRRFQAYELVSPHLHYTTIPNIEKAFVDRQNNLWLTSAHDLTLVNFRNQNVKSAPLVRNQESRSLLSMADGTMWVASSTGVIGKYDADGRLLGYVTRTGTGPDMRMTVSPSPTPFSFKIYAMHLDRKGTVWLGSKGDGIYTVDPDGSVSHYRHDRGNPYSVANDSVYDFAEDNRGNMWIATFGNGVCMVDNNVDAPRGKRRFLTVDNAFTSYPRQGSNKVRRVCTTDDGVVILSCNDGLVTFSNRFNKPGDIRFYRNRHVSGDPTSLRTNNLMQTLVSGDGSVYVASMGGAVQKLVSPSLLSDNLKFTSVNDPGNPLLLLQNAIGNGNVLSMNEDEQHNIYIVCETSIVVYSPDTNSVNVFGPNDLSEGIEFSEAIPEVCSTTGKIWFGTLGGAVYLDPTEITKSTDMPNIVFTGVQYPGESERLQLLDPDNIEVEGDRRNISVSFAALDYSNNYLLQYAYRLNNEEEWNYIGSNNIVQFNDLKPGIHRLYVKSSNGDGVWQDNEKYIDILVHPRFSETIWAKLLWIMAAMLVIYIALHFYIVHRRNQLMTELHLREHQFFIDASHRLRTPLTLIGSPVSEVLDTEKLSDKGRKHLEKVKRSANDMLELVNRLLQLGFKPGDEVSDEMKALDDATRTIIAHTSSHNSGAAADEAEQPRTTDDKRTRLLIVEDNDDLRGYLRDILSSKYNVTTASNGLKGLEKAEREQPDFIITDVTMPEMDGLTMVQHIKKNKGLSHIPIIVLSAKASMEDRIEGLNKGVDDYITKPFSATYLRQRISNIITQRRMLQQRYMEQVGSEMQSGMEALSPIDAAGRVSTPAPAADTPGTDTVENRQEAAGNHPQSRPRTEYRLDSPEIADADQEMMERLLKYMETRIGDENLKIEELADAVNMGRTVFYGKIKALVGMSPSDFLRRLRMQRAEELIAKSKMNFSQIAFNVGFSDPKYFTKCFKKETGMTPSEYRQQSMMGKKV